MIGEKLPEAKDPSAPSKHGSSLGEEPESVKIGGVDVEDAMFLAKRRV